MTYDAYAPRSPHQADQPKKGKGRKPKADEAASPETLPGDSTRAENRNGIAAGQLRSFVERIERLDEEKKEIADDIKDVYGEAKALGFDAKVIRRVIAIRKQDPDERMEFEAVLDTYLHALGMIDAEGV